MTNVIVADIYKQGDLAAHFVAAGTDTIFRYAADYSGPAIAHSLPLGIEQTRPGRSLPAFFTNLLPEGRRLSALQRAVKTSGDDELGLLLSVGQDPIGDVRIVPPGRPPAAFIEPIIKTANELDFSALLSQHGFDRVSVPGVQDKLSSGMITVSGLVSDASIVKLTPPNYPWAVENEAFFLGLAARASKKLGIKVAEARIITDIHQVAGLEVTRFDRGEQRLATEDACQLLGRYPSDKYHVTAEEVASAVAQVCKAKLVALRDIFLQFVFAWLIGNGDLHAKNISVRQEPSGEWRVSPWYDLLSTLPYEDLTSALSMGGRRKDFTRKHFLTFAHHIGLPQKSAETAIDKTLKATSGLIDALERNALPFDPNTTRTLCRRLARRRKDLLNG